MATPKSKKRIIISGILLGLGVISTSALHFLNDKNPMDNPTSCATAMIELEQKRRCGFVDLGYVRLTGVVKYIEENLGDGDLTVDIKPDPRFDYLRWYKGVETSHSKDGTIHVEIMPCERQFSDIESVLKKIVEQHKKGKIIRVAVEGRFAFDGVDHTPTGTWQRIEETKICLAGRDPGPTIGWTEVHPVYSVEILEILEP